MTKSTSAIIKESYPVLGMSCAACASSAENVVRNQTGVIEASVNYATTNLTVTYDKSILTKEDIQHVLQSAGYDLFISEEENQQAALEEIQLKEFKKLKINTIWACILAIPVVIIGMFFMDVPYGNEIMWLFTTPVLFIFGKDFFIGAWKQAKHRKANMDTLVALSTGIAYLFSIFSMLMPEFWKQS